MTWFALALSELTAKGASGEGSSITSVDPPQTELSRLSPETEQRDVDAKKLNPCDLFLDLVNTIGPQLFISNDCVISQTCRIIRARDIRWSIS